MIYDFNLQNGFNQCEIYKNISFACEKNKNYYAILVR